MVAGAFPLAKLGFLAIRQVSKPIATRLKLWAKTNNIVRKYLVIPPAQIYHKIETNSKLILMGLGKPKKVELLSEAQAVELGGDMLSEVFVFGVASAILIFEVNRQYESSAKKEADLQDRLDKIEYQLDEYKLKVERQSAEIMHLNRLIKTSTIEKIRSRILPNKNDTEKISNPSFTTGTSQEQLASSAPIDDKIRNSLPQSKLRQVRSESIIELSMDEGIRAIGVLR